MYKVNKLNYIENYHFTGDIQSLITCVFVETFFSKPQNQWTRNRIVPDNTVELILTGKKFKRVFSNPDKSQTLRSHFAGLKTQWQDIWVEGSPLISIRFQPDVLFQLSRIKAVEFKNNAIPPAEVFGPGFTHLEEELFNLQNTNDRLKRINDYFTTVMSKVRLKNDRAFHYAKNTIEQTHGDVRIHDLAERIGLSQKGLENKFKRYLGATPKEYCRLNRFIGSVKTYNSSSSSLTKWAYDNNYFDQSHLIKEFNHFTGTSPSAYFADSKGIQEEIL